MEPVEVNQAATELEKVEARLSELRVAMKPIWDEISELSRERSRLTNLVGETAYGHISPSMVEENENLLAELLRVSRSNAAEAGAAYDALDRWFESLNPSFTYDTWSREDGSSLGSFCFSVSPNANLKTLEKAIAQTASRLMRVQGVDELVIRVLENSYSFEGGFSVRYFSPERTTFEWSWNDDSVSYPERTLFETLQVIQKERPLDD